METLSKKPYNLIAERIEMLVDKGLLNVDMVSMNGKVISMVTGEFTVVVTDPNKTYQDKILMTVNVKDYSRETPIYEVNIQKYNRQVGYIVLNGIQEFSNFLTEFKVKGITLGSNTVKLLSWDSQLTRESQSLILHSIRTGVALSAYYDTMQKEVRIKFY